MPLLITEHRIQDNISRSQNLPCQNAKKYNSKMSN